MIKVMITDDEPLSRNELKYLLSKYDDINVISEAHSFSSAIDQIKSQRPDLVFLDIQMEEEDTGLKIAQRISTFEFAPLIIFITSHAQHALDAYDFSPLHYLLKPIAEGKLALALDRARELVGENVTSSPDTRKLSIKYRSIDRTGEIVRPLVYLTASEIIYIHKDKMSNTVTVYATKGRIYNGIRQTLQQFEDELKSDKFFRVHTSYLVNLDFASGQKKRSQSNENYVLQLEGSEKELPISKLKYPALKTRLDQAQV